MSQNSISTIDALEQLVRAQKQWSYFRPGQGEDSFEQGGSAQALANQSHASGLGTKATVTAQTVVGKYNAEDNTSLFVVGVGTGADTTQRMNAFTTGNDGTEDYITIGETKLTETQLKKVIEFINRIENI